MTFPTTEIQLKNGATCTLRPARLDDAEAMIDYLRQTAGETPFLVRYPDEVTFTKEGEAAFLDAVINSPRDVMIVAEVDGVLAGNCSVSPLGAPRRFRHRCEFGIALKAAYHGLGIGTRMMALALSFAKEMGYTQMELDVVATNDGARHLYSKMGFLEVGRTPGAFLLDDGTYLDECRMIKPL